MSVFLNAFSEANLTYKVEYENENIIDPVDVHVSLIDREGNIIIDDEQGSGAGGTILVENPKLWWPYLMDTDPGYLYTLQVF